MPLQRVQFKRFLAVKVGIGCVEMDAQAVLVIHRQGLSEHAMPARQGVGGGGAVIGRWDDMRRLGCGFGPKSCVTVQRLGGHCPMGVECGQRAVW